MVILAVLGAGAARDFFKDFGVLALETPKSLLARRGVWALGPWEGPSLSSAEGFGVHRSLKSSSL